MNGAKPNTVRKGGIYGVLLSGQRFTEAQEQTINK
jgi:hypothetical protein